MRARIVASLCCLLLFAGCATPGVDMFGPSHAILIEPAAPLVRPGAAVQFAAIRLNHDGTRSATNARDYEWSSSNPAVGVMNADGVFTALAAGRTEIACLERGDKRVQAYAIATVDWSAP